MPTKATEAENRSFAFKFVAGDPSLDFVNTVDWTEQGLRDDRLTDYDLSLIHISEPTRPY